MRKFIKLVVEFCKEFAKREQPIMIYDIIKGARENYVREGVYMCIEMQHEICRQTGYHVPIVYIEELIPKFNSRFLVGRELSHRDCWWTQTDRESRVKAFDKLLEEYKDSGEYITIGEIRTLLKTKMDTTK